MAASFFEATLDDGDEDEVVNEAQTNAVETVGAETVALENGGEGNGPDEGDEAEDGDEDDEADEAEDSDEGDEADEETKQEVSKPEIAVNNTISEKISNRGDKRRMKMNKVKNQEN